MSSETLTQALHLAGHGFSVIPIKPGSKTPPFGWKAYQERPADATQVRQWYETHPEWGLGVITGSVSGNLVMIELEAAAMSALPHLADLAAERDMSDLWAWLVTGWSEKTPSGGIHFHARLELGDHAMPGNTKLARDKNHHPLAETRGQGGLTVVAPTPGTCHPSGKPWTPHLGGPASCPRLTWAQYEQLCDLLAALDQAPRPATPPTTTATTATTATTRSGEGLTPGDDFEKKTTWDDILTPHGWQRVRRDGPGWAWVRPGKDARDGISATTGRDQERDRLYVFSTSTPFTVEEPYTKFGAYALLEHGGNHSEAARALRERGYGEDRTRNVVVDLPVRPRGNQDAAASQDAGADEAPTTGAGGAVAEVVPIGKARTQLRDLTEDANALMLLDVHGPELRYVAERSTWLRWNGHTWRPQPRGGGQVRELVKALVRELPTDPAPVKTWRKKSLTNSGITATLALAATDERAAITQADLDAHLDEINTPGGIVNLRAGRLMQPDPRRLHTKTTACAPDSDTATPQWDAFLAETFHGHEAVRDYLQPLLGYCLTGRTGAQILPFFHGSGANGKSVLAEVIVGLMADYASTAPADFLTRTGGNTHPTEIAQLQGARLVTASEVTEGSRFDETKIKQLTGGDSLTARYMHGDFFTFQPTHKIIVLGNDRPKVTGGGYSFWRRFRLIPFENTVPEDKRDPELAQRLIEEEGPGIMAWLVAGAAQYYEDGLTAPEEVLAATEEYEAEEDHIGRFADDRLIIGGGNYVRVRRAEMRAAYTTWCEIEGVRPMSATMFTRKVSERFNIETARSNGAHLYTNVTLANVDDDRPDSAWNDLGGGV